MNKARDVLVGSLNRTTLYLFAAAGVVASVAGTITNVPWVSQNLPSILLFELSALLAYIVLEFSSVDRRLRRLGNRSGELHILDTPESLYRAAASVLRESPDSTHVNKSVWIVSATGLPNDRPVRPRLDSVTREYYRSLSSLMNRSGWSVRIIYNIESTERLEWVRGYLNNTLSANDLEARAVLNVTREIIAPLIIGDNDIFLAQGDRRFHGVRSGIWIHDPSANLFARTYFDSLWNAPDLKVIRRATGIDSNALQAILQDLSK
jgi:hypothetical protein